MIAGRATARRSRPPARAHGRRRDGLHAPRPACPECPLRRRCATRGPLDGEVRVPPAAVRGIFRQRRGAVMAGCARDAVPAAELDADALASLVTDGLAVVDGGSRPSCPDAGSATSRPSARKLRRRSWPLR